LPENKLNKQSLLRDNVILSDESTTGERDFAPKGVRDFVPHGTREIYLIALIGSKL